MKSASVIEAFRRFLSGNSSGAVEIVRQIEAAESHCGRVDVSRQLQRLLSSSGLRPLVRLPNTPDSLSVMAGVRPMNTVVLSDATRKAVAGFAREWKFRDVLFEHGLPLRRVLLLSGPSGNGKTTLAHAIATELGLPLAVAQYEHLFDSHLGCTGSNVAKVFAFAAATPCVVFIDEADALVSARSGASGDAAGREGNRIVSSVIMSLDSIARSVVVFATNAPEMIDVAVLRRCAMRLELPPPGPEERSQMCRLLLERWPVLSKCNGWSAGTDSAESLAAIEEVALVAAREFVLDSAGEAH